MSFEWLDAVVLAGGFGAAWLTARQVSRLPRVWRGETLRELPAPVYPVPVPEVHHRSFPVFTGFCVCLGGGALLISLSVVFDLHAPGVIGVSSALIGVVVFLPLWMLINAVNRPRALVPPSQRNETGWWGEWRARRARARRRTSR